MLTCLQATRCRGSRTVLVYASCPPAVPSLVRSQSPTETAIFLARSQWIEEAARTGEAQIGEPKQLAARDLVRQDDAGVLSTGEEPFCCQQFKKSNQELVD